MADVFERRIQNNLFVVRSDQKSNCSKSKDIVLEYYSGDGESHSYESYSSKSLQVSQINLTRIVLELRPCTKMDLKMCYFASFWSQPDGNTAVNLFSLTQT